MPAAELYRRQAALLVKAIPLAATETCFALEGGTAINLFVRDMPRLSVDIDLTYLPIADRAASLREIDAGMRRIAVSIGRRTPGARVSPSRLQDENRITKLIVARRRRADQNRGHTEPARMRLRTGNQIRLGACRRSIRLCRNPGR
jgi:hypothetical protein